MGICQNLIYEIGSFKLKANKKSSYILLVIRDHFTTNSAVYNVHCRRGAKKHRMHCAKSGHGWTWKEVEPRAGMKSALIRAPFLVPKIQSHKKNCNSQKVHMFWEGNRSNGNSGVLSVLPICAKFRNSLRILQWNLRNVFAFFDAESLPLEQLHFQPEEKKSDSLQF